MKGTLSVLIFIYTFPTISQTNAESSEKIATFCKVWGFLKYYHPEVAKGKIDWDREFTNRVSVVTRLNSKQELSAYYSAWIAGLGEVTRCKKCKNDIPDSLKFNLDLSWLSDSTVFSKNLMDQLHFIRDNRNQGKNYYVQSAFYIGNTTYAYEKPYQDSVFPSTNLRLLALARYWNIINYFFPYKYLIGEDWNKALVDMIPKFKDSGDTVAYHMAMLELTARTNDSHAIFSTPYTKQYFGLMWAPFKFQIIDSKAIVTHFWNDSLCKKNDIREGDVFLTIGNLSVEEILKEKLPYISASNNPTKLRNAYSVLFNGPTEAVNTQFERGGLVAEKIIYRYPAKDLKYHASNEPKPDTCRISEGNIGYINMGLLQPKQTKSYLRKLKNTNAIIFDQRNYPNRTMYRIAQFLNADNKPFAKFTKPDLSYPGVYYYTAPYTCGKKKNKKHYTGKVLLLFNELTQSQAEFTLMALQTAPNVTGIGSQTAGADGDISQIIFPGNYKTYMTGIGVYYPDGRETQRVGIVPDIEVKPTIEGLKQKRDEVLEKALEVINKQ